MAERRATTRMVVVLLFIWCLLPSVVRRSCDSRCCRTGTYTPFKTTYNRNKTRMWCVWRR
jgi:hypothetical protein